MNRKASNGMIAVNLKLPQMEDCFGSTTAADQYKHTSLLTLDFGIIVL